MGKASTGSSSRKKAASKRTSSKKAARTSATKSVAKKTTAKKTAAKRTSAKRTAAKKAATKTARSTGRTPKKTRRRAAKAASPALSKNTSRSSRSTIELSLEQIAERLPSAPPEHVDALYESLLEAQPEPLLIEKGTEFRTEDILAAAPGFAAGVLAVIEKLSRRMSPLPGVGPASLALFVREAMKLRDLNLTFEQQAREIGSNVSRQRAELKLANSRALQARRGTAQALLRAVVPRNSGDHEALVVASRKAGTPAATVASTNAVAAILERLRQDERHRRVLDVLHYDDEHVQKLRALAADVERLAAGGGQLMPPRSVDQKALDLQDGIVLAIMQLIWAPLRDARASGVNVSLPPVGKLARFFIRSSAPFASDDGEDEDDEMTGDELEASAAASQSDGAAGTTA